MSESLPEVMPPQPRRLFSCINNSRWYRYASFVVLSAILLLPNVSLAQETRSDSHKRSALEVLINDANNVYTGKRLMRMGIITGSGGIAHNSTINGDIQDWYFAWEALRPVFNRFEHDTNIEVSPMFLRDGFGFTASFDW